MHVHPRAGVVLEREHLALVRLELRRAAGDAREPVGRHAGEQRKRAKALDIHDGFSIRTRPRAASEPDRYAPNVHALDLRRPLYGEDRERGDLRD